MIVRTLEQIRGTDREVQAKTWVSRRLLLKKDGMGFSMHETVLHAGTVTRMCYKNHLEAVYCVDGRGELEEVVSGIRHPISPGTLYALNEHDQHVVRAKTDIKVICVFTPPCTGRETHDAEGSYPLLDEHEAVTI